MSRITGSDAFGLMEAYAAVYAPQELTEEQVWEEVEAWVNSLVEEGYDLSEYTWEDMYEYFINEDLIGDLWANRRKIGSAISGAATRVGQAASNVNQAMFNRMTRRPDAKPQIGGLPSDYRGAELQAAARARASQVGTPRQGTAGGPTTGGNTPIGTSPTRTTTQPPTTTTTQPPTRTTTQTSTRPTAAPTGGVAKQTTTATTAPAATPAAPRRRDTSITDMIGRSQIRQGTPINTGNASSDIRSRALRGTVTSFGGAGGSVAAPVSAPKPNLQQQIRQRRLNMDLDLFDIVKGYLIDEGYAETEEAAAVIMANMSDEWRETILDEGFKKMNRSKIEKQAKRLGGDRGDILRDVASRMDTPAERRYSTSQARRNRAGGAGSEYRKAQELRARDDAKADFEKYGLR